MSVPCPDCGRLNRAGARYCASCQAPLNAVATPLQPGQMLEGGTYRVLQPLGKGGMGAVYLVAQTKAFDRPAVVKEVIDYFDPTDPEARRKAASRFEAEARTLGDLRHPGIPDLYAFFSEGGHNYLVMEYIEGHDLRQALTREDEETGELRPAKRLPPDAVLRYAAQVCEVLEYLARRQPPVVHNDIKPGNIIVDRHSGRAVLVDFGTAKTRYLRVSGQPQQGKDSIYGTVGYAAPELYRGQSEPRSDVYSLAATAYHLITDDDPRDHPFQYPRLDTLPATLSDLLGAALAESPEDRPLPAQFRKQLELHLVNAKTPERRIEFPGGESPTDRGDLLSLSVRYWSYAAAALGAGAMASWLRDVPRDNKAAEAAEAAVKQWPNDHDAALDALIRQLEPTLLSPAMLVLKTPSIRPAAVARGQRIREQIVIANEGHGHMRGTAFGTQPWIQLSAQLFSCPPGRTCVLGLEINTTNLQPGTAPVGAVTLATAGGAVEVVPVQVALVENKQHPTIAVRGPAIEVEPDRVDFGTVLSGALSTPRKRVMVTNVGDELARCRVRGAPRWLLVRPEDFRLEPGASQPLEFVGRVNKVRGRRERVDVRLDLSGGKDQELEVSLRIRGGGLLG